MIFAVVLSIVSFLFSNLFNILIWLNVRRLAKKFKADSSWDDQYGRVIPYDSEKK